MIEQFKKSLDQGGDYASLLTDISKPFHCLAQELIIAKLHVYKFDKALLRLTHTFTAVVAPLKMGYLKVHFWVQFYLIYFI